MLKIVLLVLVVGLVLWFARSRAGGGGKKHAADAPTKPAATGSVDEPAPMLACAHCGVHLPKPDALFDVGGRPFCTDAHRLAGPK